MIRSAPRLLAAALALSGCAAGQTTASGPVVSRVEGVDAADLDTLADAAVDLVRGQASATDGTIGLQSAGDDRFTPRLVDKLNEAGYGVVNGDRLRYQVGPLGDALMLRVSIDGRDAARLYARDKDGRLGPAGPLSVWSVGK
jgi:hypothetical protein